VTSAAGLYLPTETADRGIADKLGIPLAYLRKLRSDRPDMYDANVNGWLHGNVDHPLGAGEYPADSRSFMLRLLKGDDEGSGIARAWLSDRYKVIDNLDILVAALDGVRQSGASIKVEGCDLTESRMYVRISAPEVADYAPGLLKNYRNPWGGGRVRAGHFGEDIAGALRAAHNEGMERQDLVFAGFVITNSELGNGAFTIVPRLVIQICDNGLTITADALRAVHLGARMDQGVVKYSEDTEEKRLALVTAQARDAVKTFLDPAYVNAKISEIEALAGEPVKDAPKVVAEVVAKSVIPADLESTVLDFFVAGGQMTAGGVMQAVTAAAQSVDDGDLAAEMEGAALGVLQHAASLAA
jgi:hypothetical protein